MLVMKNLAEAEPKLTCFISKSKALHFDKKNSGRNTQCNIIVRLKRSRRVCFSPLPTGVLLKEILQASMCPGASVNSVGIDLERFGWSDPGFLISSSVRR